MSNAALTLGQSTMVERERIFAPGQGVGLYKQTDGWVVVTVDKLRSTRWSGPSAADALALFLRAEDQLDRLIRSRARAEREARGETRANGRLMEDSRSR
jgi:hypothetical protein